MPASVVTLRVHLLARVRSMRALVLRTPQLTLGLLPAGAGLGHLGTFLGLLVGRSACGHQSLLRASRAALGHLGRFLGRLPGRLPGALASIPATGRRDGRGRQRLAAKEGLG